jgi:DNA-binding Lrp family transcriptional regulator
MTTQGHKGVPTSLDVRIIEELLNDAYVSSTDISKKHKAPLSTVQRRRKFLEDTLLTRRYEISLYFLKMEQAEQLLQGSFQDTRITFFLSA